MAPKAALLLLSVQLSLLLVSFISAQLLIPTTPEPPIQVHWPVPITTPTKPPVQVHPAPIKPPTKSPVPVHPAPIKPPVQVHPAPIKPPTKSPVPVHPAPIKPPTKSPVPVHPAPIKPPTKSPVPVHPAPNKPPSHLPAGRKQIAIRGVVYCKSCNNKGGNTLMGAKPLFKAVVKLECNSTAKQHHLVETRETDKNGVYVFRPNKVSTRMEFRKCKVFLVSSSNMSCSAPTNINNGVSGAVLIHDHKKTPVAASIMSSPHFNVRPLAFEPSKKC